MWSDLNQYKWRYLTGVARRWNDFAAKDMTLVIPVPADAPVPRGFQAATFLSPPRVLDLDDNASIWDLLTYARREAAEKKSLSDARASEMSFARLQKQIKSLEPNHANVPSALKHMLETAKKSNEIASKFRILQPQRAPGYKTVPHIRNKDEAGFELLFPQGWEENARQLDRIRLAAEALGVSDQLKDVPGYNKVVSEAIAAQTDAGFIRFMLDMQRATFFPKTGMAFANMKDLGVAGKLEWLTKNPALLPGETVFEKWASAGDKKAALKPYEGFKFGGMTWLKTSVIKLAAAEPGAVADEQAIYDWQYNQTPGIMPVWQQQKKPAMGLRANPRPWGSNSPG
jgi:hypothetical protein